MRTFLTICFVAMYTLAGAQHVTITLKSGEKKTLTAGANTATALLTSKGMIKYSDIDSLTFHGYESIYDGLRDRLLHNGVKVSVSAPIDIEPEEEEEIPVQSPLLRPAPSTANTDAIAMDKFVDQRNGGKLLQLVGVIALGAASYLAMNPPDENFQDFQKALPWIGLGSMGLGIVIDMDAGKHLRKRDR